VAGAAYRRRPHRAHPLDLGGLFLHHHRLHVAVEHHEEHRRLEAVHRDVLHVAADRVGLVVGPEAQRVDAGDELVVVVDELHRDPAERHLVAALLAAALGLGIQREARARGARQVADGEVGLQPLVPLRVARARLVAPLAARFDRGGERDAAVVSADAHRELPVGAGLGQTLELLGDRSVEVLG